jgi:MazG family protein
MATLVRTMDTLRSRYGCPWDREQTHASLAKFLVEEAYELIDVIEQGDDEALTGELGDVLFQCVFHAQIAAEDGRFDLADSMDAIVRKLIRRHPHVFTPAGRPLGAGARKRRSAKSSGAVITQWEVIKAKEQADSGTRSRVLAGVPRALPSLLRAYEIGTRVAAVGFDWPTPAEVVDKIDEEVRELRGALGEGQARAAEELGDLLFSVANLARTLGLEPEAVLRGANDKFTRRFAALEDDFAARGRAVHGASAANLDSAWHRAKAATATAAPSAPTSVPARSAGKRRGRRSRG